jgi:hypothetical protein
MTALALLPAPTPLAGESPPSPAARIKYLRLTVAVAVVVAVALLGLVNRSAIGSGTATLAGGDDEWLSFAVVLIAGLWIAGTAAQLGAVPIRPPGWQSTLATCNAPGCPDRRPSPPSG